MTHRNFFSRNFADMKKAFATLGVLVILALHSFALEKIINTQTQKNLGTTNYHRLPGQSSFTNNATFEALSFKEIAVSITASQVLKSTNSIGTGSNIVFYLYKSVDRTHLDTTPFQTLTLTLTGTNNPTTLVTNFSIAGIPYINFYNHTNNASTNAYVTNLTVWVHGKY